MIRHIILFLALTLVTVTAHANPWQTAVQKNDVAALSELLAEHRETTHRHGPNMWLEAMDGEKMEVLDWLNENEIPGVDGRFGPGKISLWRMAFANKKLEAAKWLVLNRIVGLVDAHGVGPWGLAAGCEFIEMLKWLKANEIHLGDASMIWRAAFSNGRVESLKWLFENNIPNPPHEDGRNLWLFASTFDDTETLDWADEVELPGRHEADEDGQNMWLLAATFGNLNVLKWLHKNDQENFSIWEPAIRLHALENEHFHITGWLDELAGTHDNIRAILPGLAVQGFSH